MLRPDSVMNLVMPWLSKAIKQYLLQYSDWKYGIFEESRQASNKFTWVSIAHLWVSGSSSISSFFSFDFAGLRLLELIFFFRYEQLLLIDSFEKKKEAIS